MISKKKSVKVTEKSLEEFLGVPKYRYGEIESEPQIGIVTGLAWTDVGGELLTIEGVMMPGKGKMTVTGNLRDVMKESISAAASYVRSRAVAFGIEPPLFDKRDIHVHVPEGATPKDGPSAGVAMVTAIVSVMTGIAARRDLAMTGEITLRGRVLPIGSTRPRSVISPVMATSRRTGMPVITETIAVTMATPADGPSLGVAPSGTCTWMSRLSNKGGWMPNGIARIRT